MSYINRYIDIITIIQYYCSYFYLLVNMLDVKIQSLGHYLPSQLVTSESLDERLGLATGSVEKKSGLSSRHFATDDETTSFMGAKAALDALNQANLSIHDIDAIISACGVGEQALPCTAALIQKQLGLEKSGIPCFDINATCLSFTVALETAAYFIASSRFKRILIVASDMPSRGLNWNDLDTCSIFGDGAAAAIIEPSNGTSAIYATHLETHSQGSDYCCLKAGGTKIPASDIKHYQQFATFYMDGKKVFKLARKLIDNTMDALLTQAQVTISQLDWLIPHQGSQLALSHIKKRLNIADAKFADCYRKLGNQMAASILSVMSVLSKSGQLKRGQLICLLGSGAGLAAGGIIMVY